MFDVSLYVCRRALQGSHCCLPALGGEQTLALQAARLGSPCQPSCGMLSKMGILAGSHGCFHRCTGQEGCQAAPYKGCPQGGAVGQAMGPAAGHRGCLSLQGCVGGCSRQGSRHLMGSQSGKSCGKTFLHKFVQTGDLNTVVDLRKRQNEWDAAACVGHWQPSWSAGLCYRSLVL